MAEWIAREEARAGDVIVIHGHHLGEHEQAAEILEVLGEGEHLHFRIRWDDGREAVFYPGNDATIRRAHVEPPA